MSKKNLTDAQNVRPKGVEAVDRALTILECFKAGPSEQSLADLARATGYYKSTILRLAISLENFGFLIRGENGRFRLGSASWHLGSSYRQGFDLGDVVRPELRSLCEATQETASFYVREGENRICFYRVEPSRSIRHTIAEGIEMPVGRGASGRVLLAYSGDESPSSIALRREGVAVSMGERDPEVAAIAAPVIAQSGRLAGAVTVSGLITRFTGGVVNDLTQIVKESGRTLSSQIQV